MAVIPDRDMLDSDLLIVGMHIGRYDADRGGVAIPGRPSPDIVLEIRTRLAAVIGVPGLRLKGEEDR
ncbi:MAG TPA: hypothetical protein VHG52_07820 [Thermomicrobiales bacterium]|nr:hypothetical protein [Thermomicrobiales bacterium]